MLLLLLLLLLLSAAEAAEAAALPPPPPVSVLEAAIADKNAFRSIDHLADGAPPSIPSHVALPLGMISTCQKPSLTDGADSTPFELA